ncbi:MAG: hypothetical protein SVW02_01860 [Candidatus Nanohaloarchaea archaeon]|nr:hypothetical protein [Candidatus Nanohaloarchaea archaeon]
MTAECKECDWEGEEDALEYFRCPSCGSRNLKTDGSRGAKHKVTPPDGAMQGGMGA